MSGDKNQVFYDTHLPRGFNHACEINKPYGEIDKILDWNRSTLSGDWRWQMATHSTAKFPGRYVFYFDQERDFLAFILNWR